ncbi:MAG: hypothetical protein ACRCWG_04590 [Sarcina sp.]
MSNTSVACRHLGRFFKASIDFDLEPIEFILKALKSEYKVGIETYTSTWYSQSPYYYLEEFLESNSIKKYIYAQEDIVYEKERMYWMGFCLQYWSNRTTLKGKDIASLWGESGIEQLLKHYKIYHTVDPLVVLEDSIEVNEIEINFNEILDF